MRSVVVRGLTETTVVMSSVGFLAWYIWAKMATSAWHF